MNGLRSMPNRIVREGILTSERGNRWINLSVKRRIGNLPCAICGGTYKVQVDHIVPVSVGGSNEESNLQPLCFQCNHKKSDRLTNQALSAWVSANRSQHLERDAYLRAIQYSNPYDAPTIAEWRANKGA